MSSKFVPLEGLKLRNPSELLWFPSFLEFAKNGISYQENFQNQYHISGLSPGTVLSSAISIQ